MVSVAREAVAVAPEELKPPLQFRLLSSTGDTVTVQVVKGSVPLRGRGAYELLRREVWPDERVRLTLSAWPRLKFRY
jgi:hypothetical protein